MYSPKSALGLVMLAGLLGTATLRAADDDVAALRRKAAEAVQKSEKNAHEAVREEVVALQNVLTASTVQDNVERQAEETRSRIRAIIGEVAEDIELSGSSGTITRGPDGNLEYRGRNSAVDTAEADVKAKYKAVKEAKAKNNISIRTVKLAFQLFANVNKQILTEASDAKANKNFELYARLALTQAMFVREMAAATLSLLDKVTLEGLPAIQAVRTKEEEGASKRIAQAREELKSLDLEVKNGAKKEAQIAADRKLFESIVSANERNIAIWNEFMSTVEKQGGAIEDAKKKRGDIERKMKAASIQYDTLKSAIVTRHINIILMDMDDVLNTVTGLDLMLLDDDAVDQVVLGKIVEEGDSPGETTHSGPKHKGSSQPSSTESAQPPLTR